MPRTNDSRARTVRAAAGLISERGVAGTGLRDVVAAAGTPRGSLSHHFPGGKDELVIEAVTWSALKLRERLDALAAADPPATVADVLAAMVRWWERGMLAVDFNGGCVVAATVVDGTGTDVRRAAQRAFESWLDPLTRIAAARRPRAGGRPTVRGHGGRGGRGCAAAVPVRRDAPAPARRRIDDAGARRRLTEKGPGTSPGARPSEWST